MTPTLLEPGFLDLADGRRFFLYQAPRTGEAVGAAMFVAPFAEEMNKSRRMAALQCRALAEAGFATLRLDLFGCGDSDGDLADASWGQWLADVAAGLAELRRRCAAPPWLWGLRSGALLAGQAAGNVPGLHGLLLWQPMNSGKAVVQQFLRLESAGRLTDASRASASDLRARIAAGETLEVAGYPLCEGLVAGLEAATLAAPAAGIRTVWLEVSSRPDPAMLPGSAATLARWRDHGFDVHAAAVPGPSFWQTTEIEEAPALLQATTDILCGAAARVPPA